MSEPGKAETISQDDHLKMALMKSKNKDQPADIFHKKSYMKDFKLNVAGSTEIESKEVAEMDWTEEEKEVFESGNQKWEHSKIYSWVNAAAEKKAILSLEKPLTKSFLRNRESTRYNALMQYKESDCKWVEKDNKIKNPDTKEEKRPEDYVYVIRPKKLDTPDYKTQKHKSSYLSWILDTERTPFSEQSRVYSLPQYEENFWNDMLSIGDPAKGIDPGYLTLDKVGFQIALSSNLIGLNPGKSN